MIEGKGYYLSSCYQCKKENRYSLTYTCFLYRIPNDNFKHAYCYNCAKKLENK